MRAFRFPCGGVGMLAAGLAAIGVLALAAAALAQSGGPYDLGWNTVDGGGGASSGGSFTLSGSAGQADAGAMWGGAYTLDGGFWAGAGHAAVYRVYLPLVMRDEG